MPYFTYSKAISFTTVSSISFLLEPSTIMGGLPWWLSGKEPACQCRRRGLDPWTEKIPLATRISVLACKIPWTEEFGRLQAMGLQETQIQLSD